jgi:hypothetical protein
MCQLTGDSKYVDVLERSLYNGALDGLSLSGDHFFYDNVLASNGQNQRREWFGTACCPANIARLVTSVGNYIYGKSNDGIWINLFVGSNTNIKMGNTDVGVKMETNYPLDGKVRISIDPEEKRNFSVRIRIPDWQKGAVVPGDLYKNANASESVLFFTVNGRIASYVEEDGYAILDRKWQKGDVISFEFNMPVTKIAARPEVRSDVDRIALQRGPLVYCLEGADNKDGVWNVVLPPNTKFTLTDYKILDEAVVALQAEVPSAVANDDGDGIKIENRKITAIPYYCWANRGGKRYAGLASHEDQRSED